MKPAALLRFPCFSVVVENAHVAPRKPCVVRPNHGQSRAVYFWYPDHCETVLRLIPWYHPDRLRARALSEVDVFDPDDVADEERESLMALLANEAVLIEHVGTPPERTFAVRVRSENAARVELLVETRLVRPLHGASTVEVVIHD